MIFAVCNTRRSQTKAKFTPPPLNCKSENIRSCLRLSDIASLDRLLPWWINKAGLAKKKQTLISNNDSKRTLLKKPKSQSETYSHQQIMHEDTNDGSKQQRLAVEGLPAGAFQGLSLAEEWKSNPLLMSVWVFLIWSALEVGGRKQACAILFFYRTPHKHFRLWSRFIYHSSHPHPPVMVATFLGWKGTVSADVHGFRRANVCIYTQKYEGL